MSRMMILFQIEVYPQRWQRYRLLSDFTSVEKSSPMRRASLTRFSPLLGVWTHFRALNLLYVPRLTGRSMRRSYLVFKEMISARGSVRSSLEGGTSFLSESWDFGKLHQNVGCWDGLIFSSQVFPPLPRPLPAVDRRNARPVRGRQHHDQDAGAILFISLLFSWNCIITCRRSKTCPTSAATPRSRLFPRSPTFSPNSSRWSFQPCRFGHFAKHLTLSRKSSLNISFSRVKTEGRSQW